MDFALTPLVRLSFAIHNSVFHYMYPFYYKIADTKAPLLQEIYTDDPIQLLPFHLMQVLGFLGGFVTPVIIVLNEFLNSPEVSTFITVKTGMLLWISFMEAVMFGLLWLTAPYRKVLFHAWNCGVEVEYNIIKDLKHYLGHLTKKKSVIPRNPKTPSGIFLCLIPPGLAFMAIPGAILVVALDAEPIYFLFEIILPPKFERPVFLTVISVTVRLFICTFYAMEMIRLASYAVLTFVSAALVGQSILTKLALNLLPVRISFSYCNQLRILYATAEPWINTLLCVGMGASQTMSTLLMCFVLLVWDRLPLFISAVMIILSFGIIAFMVTMVRLISRAAEKMDAYIRTNRRRFFVSRGKRGMLTFYHKQWVAQQPQRPSCGPLFPLQQETSGTYLECLLNNVVDGVLLF